MNLEERRTLRRVALGQEPADLVVKNGRLIHTWTREVLPGGVAVKGDRIAAVGEVDYAIGRGTQVIDAGGSYLAPGFIDCHLHVGGSQLSSTELARLTLARGTAAICTDFYEPFTVGGQAAGRFLADEWLRTPLILLFSPFFAALLGLGPWGNPDRYSPQDLLDTLDWPEIIGTREWQAGVAELPVDPVHEFMARAAERRLIFEGHLEGRHGRVLQAGVAYAARSDHEMANLQEALERARLGVATQARQGSAIWDVGNVMRGLGELSIDTRAFMLSTDEMDADEIAREGHVNYKMRLCVEEGVDPLVAVQMATLNAAQFFHLTDELGSLTPGRLAYIVELKDLERFEVGRVVARGELVAEDGRYTAPLDPPEYPAEAYQTMHLHKRLAPSDLAIPALGGLSQVRCRVIGVREGSIITQSLVEPFQVREGQVHADPSRDLAKFVVIDRHLASGAVGRGFIRGFGLQAGAFGSSFNPGISDVAVVGVDDRDMTVVANRIVELGGGYVVARGGRVLAEMPLPLWGILSDERYEVAVSQQEAVHRAIREGLGSPFRGIHTGMGFCCLTIIVPSLKICAKGLVEVDRDAQEAVELFV